MPLEARLVFPSGDALQQFKSDKRARVMYLLANPPGSQLHTRNPSDMGFEWLRLVK
jgi:hypothetical protein